MVPPCCSYPLMSSAAMVLFPLPFRPLMRLTFPGRMLNVRCSNNLFRPGKEKLRSLNSIMSPEDGLKSRVSPLPSSSRSIMSNILSAEILASVISLLLSISKTMGELKSKPREKKEVSSPTVSSDLITKKAPATTVVSDMSLLRASETDAVAEVNMPPL